MRRILLVLAVCLLPVVTGADTVEQHMPDELPANETGDGVAEDATADEASEAISAQDLMTLLSSATEDQRARTLRFIRNRYPDLTAELLALMQSREPGIFEVLDRELQNLLTAHYPRLSTEVQRILQQTINERYPQVRREIGELMARDYPDLVASMREAGSGDPSSRAADLIRERYRSLLDDVLNHLRAEHQTLLQEVQREVLVKHPELLAEVAGLIAERYPQMSVEVTEILTQKYPNLVPGILSILAPEKEENAPTGGGATQNGGAQD